MSDIPWLDSLFGAGQSDMQLIILGAGGLIVLLVVFVAGLRWLNRALHPDGLYDWHSSDWAGDEDADDWYRAGSPDSWDW